METISADKSPLRFLRSPWVILLAIGLGVAIGLFAKPLAEDLIPFGSAFIALLKMFVVPLIMSAVVSSLAHMLRTHGMGSAIKKLLLFSLLGLILLGFLGFLLGIVFNIGGNIDELARDQLGSLVLTTKETLAPVAVDNIWLGFLHRMVSENILASIVGGNNLPLLTFSILLGIALGIVTSRSSYHTWAVFDGLFKALLKIVGGIIYLLPFALICIIAGQVAQLGVDVFAILAQLLLCAYGLLVFLFLILTFIVSRRVGLSWWRTMTHLRQPLTIGFFTGSSLATLPFALQVLHQGLGRDRDQVNSFLPIATSFNFFGVVTFLCFYIVFLCHLYQIPITPALLMTGLFATILTSLVIGTVPAIAAFSLTAILFEPLGLPVAPAVALLLAIAQLLDPFLTSLGVLGNTTIVSLVADKDQKLSVKTKDQDQ